MVVVGACGFGWMGTILADRIALITIDGGWRAVVGDGRIQHGVGELMATVSFFAILVSSKVWPLHRVLALSARLRGVMVVGGLLNGLAWYSTSAEAWNTVLRLWCLCLLGFGFMGASSANWLVTREYVRNRREA